MIKGVRNDFTDLRGLSRMVVDAICGTTGLVEALHTGIASKPARLAGATVGSVLNGTTSIVYTSIRGITRAVGAGIDFALDAAAPALGHIEPSPVREAVIAALNGVLGDYLVKTGNPLAITMRLRREGKPLELTRAGLAAGIQVPSSKVLVLVHGLCRNDRSWERNGHDHGAELARDLSYTAVYLHTWTPPHCQAFFCVLGVTGGTCSHTSGLGLQREAAGPDGICWSTPNHYSGLLMSREDLRLIRPRFDL